MIFPLVLPRLPGGNRQKFININPITHISLQQALVKQDLLVSG